jgi:Spy/CpxP family protein refolding chaperone
MRPALWIVAGLAIAPAYAADAASHAGHGAAPYAGQQSREIKALSEDEMAGYLAGAGMGFAKAAELNGYPGPMHSLEHAAALGLSAGQRAGLEALMQRHKEEARRLGAQVVRLERELDALFAAHSATPATIDAKLAEIAATQARVRGSHLKTHLAATALLTPEQVARYNELRGYSRGS